MLGSLAAWQLGRVSWASGSVAQPFSSDAAQYWDLGGNLLAGRGFVNSPGLGHEWMGFRNSEYVPNIVRAPAYPAVLGVARLVKGTWDVGYTLNLALYWGFVIYGVFLLRIWRPGLSRRWLFAAAVLLAFSPAALIAARWGGVDLFAALAFTAFVVHVLMLALPGAKRGALVGATTVGLASVWGVAAILARPNAVFFVAPILVGGLATVYLRSGASRYRMAPLLIVSIVVSSAFVGWCVHGFKVSGRFSPAPSSGHHIWANYTRSLPQGEAPPDFDRAAFMRSRIAGGENSTKAEADASAKLQRIALRQIRKDPVSAAKTLAISYVRSFTDAYLRLGSVVTARVFGVRLQADSELDRQQLGAKGPGAWTVYLLLRLATALWGVLLAIALFAYPLVLRALRCVSAGTLMRFSVWIAVLFYWAATFLVVDPGDRLRLPIDAFLVCFLFDLGAFLALRRSAGRRMNPLPAEAQT